MAAAPDDFSDWLVVGRLLPLAATASLAPAPATAAPASATPPAALLDLDGPPAEALPPALLDAAAAGADGTGAPAEDPSNGGVLAPWLAPAYELLGRAYAAWDYLAARWLGGAASASPATPQPASLLTFSVSPEGAGTYRIVCRYTLPAVAGAGRGRREHVTVLDEAGIGARHGRLVDVLAGWADNAVGTLPATWTLLGGHVAPDAYAEQLQAYLEDVGRAAPDLALAIWFDDPAADPFAIEELAEFHRRTLREVAAQACAAARQFRQQFASLADLFGSEEHRAQELALVQHANDRVRLWHRVELELALQAKLAARDACAAAMQALRAAARDRQVAPPPRRALLRRARAAHARHIEARKAYTALRLQQAEAIIRFHEDRLNDAAKVLVNVLADTSDALFDARFELYKADGTTADAAGAQAPATAIKSMRLRSGDRCCSQAHHRDRPLGRCGRLH